MVTWLLDLHLQSACIMKEVMEKRNTSLSFKIYAWKNLYHNCQKMSSHVLQKNGASIQNIVVVLLSMIMIMCTMHLIIGVAVRAPLSIIKIASKVVVVIRCIIADLCLYLLPINAISTHTIIKLSWKNCSQ